MNARTVDRGRTWTDTSREVSAALECLPTPVHGQKREREHDVRPLSSSLRACVFSLHSAGLRPGHFFPNLQTGNHLVDQDLDVPKVHAERLSLEPVHLDHHDDREGTGRVPKDAGQPLRSEGGFHHVGV